jgi:predicted dehydrogenase
VSEGVDAAGRLPVQVNVVGLGRWGPNLVRCFAAHPGARVRTVCDLDPARLDRVRDHVPGVDRFTTDSTEAVTQPGVDAVVIATPVETHAALTRAALEAGKHVLVEKPLCGSVAEGRALAELASAQGRVLAVGHVFLFNRGIRYAREQIEAGRLGELRYAFATRTNLGPVRPDVNALWDLGAHDLSIFRHWLGADPVSVTAHGHRFLGGEREDVVVAGFAYPGGQVAYVHASWLNPRKVREITLVGSERMLVWDDMDLAHPVRVYEASVDLPKPPGPGDYADSFGGFRALVRQGDIIIPKVAGGEPLATEAAHFLDCVRGDATPLNDAEGAVRILAALEAADRSLAQGGAEVAVEESV